MLVAGLARGQRPKMLGNSAVEYISRDLACRMFRLEKCVGRSREYCVHPVSKFLAFFTVLFL